MLRRALLFTALLIVVALCSFPTALAMDIAEYNSIHYQVSWANHWLGELGRLLHVPPGFVTTNLYRTTIALATESLFNHLQHSCHGYIERRKRPLEEITNIRQQQKAKKRGRKSSGDQ